MPARKPKVADPARGLVRIHRRGKWFTIQVNAGGYWMQIGGAETRWLMPDAMTLRAVIRNAVTYSHTRRKGGAK